MDSVYIKTMLTVIGAAQLGMGISTLIHYGVCWAACLILLSAAIFTLIGVLLPYW